MLLRTRLGWWLLVLVLNCSSHAFAVLQPASAASSVQHSTEETVLRTLAEAFYRAWAAQDLEGYLRLWSASAPEMEANKKATAELFANSTRIALTSFAVRRVGLAGKNAWVRVELDAQVIDAQTGKEKAGYGNVQRTLACAKEGDGWRVVRELVSIDALAEAVVAAKGEEERSAILESLDNQSAVADTLIRVGRLYVLRVEYELALSSLQRVRDLSEAAGNKAKVVIALQRIGEVRRLMGQYNEALETYQQSLSLAEKINARESMADLHRRIATVHTLLGRHDSALAEIDQGLSIAKELKNTFFLAASLNDRGNIYSGAGRYSEGIEDYQQALALAEGSQATGAMNKAQATSIMDSCLNNLGIAYRIQGDYRRALENLQKSVKLAEVMGDQAGVAQTLNSIGIVYSKQGDQVVALEYFNRSLSMLGEAKGRTTVDVLDNIGAASLLQENYAQALQFYGRALTLAESSQDQPARARALIGLGEVYYRTQKYESAAASFQQVLALNVRSLNNEAFTALLSLGKCRYRQGDYVQALELANRANALNQDFESKEMTAALGELRGTVYVAMNDPQKARQAFDESIAALEALRASIASDERGQSLFFANRLAAYHGVVSLLIQRGQPTESLGYAERSKARVILDVLRNGRVDVHRALTAEERQQESKFKETLFGLNRQLTQARQSGADQPQKITELREQIKKAQLNYEVFLGATYAAHPELKVQRSEAPVIQAEDLVALLPDAHTALLEYVVTEDKTYLFVITRAADVQVYTVPISRDELTKQIEGLRQQLADRDLGFRAAARGLYQLLLKPAEAQLRSKTNLIIAPDATLWDLPFQALITGANRFLIESAAISYAPSLTALREMTKRRKNQSGNSASTTLLALGNPLLGKAETIGRAELKPRDERLNRLPEAEQEVMALRQLYGTSRSKVYIGVEAREDRVKREAGQARILHFATHGMLNNASPMYSHLALAEGGANEDGLLEAWELMQLDLKADLAVLSACETARGHIGAGEGMIGLSWAMFIAGVPSIVVSQWKVESASTRDLMVDFHRSLISQPGTGKAKSTKTDALRQAALKLMKNPETRHPFYWAGFVLVGDGR
ncbi:MAG TPA: CHAT domain-containing protein [Blastocatellia bacterium]|nr:CHAT domain-containing protein [Blastocatellia bacterium]